MKIPAAEELNKEFNHSIERLIIAMTAKIQRQAIASRNGAKAVGI